MVWSEEEKELASVDTFTLSLTVRVDGEQKISSPTQPNQTNWLEVAPHYRQTLVTVLFRTLWS